MSYNWDIFIDERKIGGNLEFLGALVLHAQATEGLYHQLRKRISKFEGSGTKIGEIHWGELSSIEAKVAKDWIAYFLSGPLIFYIALKVRNGESKLEATQRLIICLEQDSKVPGGLNRGSTTVHLDIDNSDPNNILRTLRADFGLLRAFKWDSKSSLLLQLSDLLLGVANADSDGSLDNLEENASKGKKIKKCVLEYARSEARKKAQSGKKNAVVVIDASDVVNYCLV